MLPLVSLDGVVQLGNHERGVDNEREDSPAGADIGEDHEHPKDEDNDEGHEGEEEAEGDRDRQHARDED